MSGKSPGRRSRIERLYHILASSPLHADLVEPRDVVLVNLKSNVAGAVEVVATSVARVDQRAVEVQVHVLGAQLGAYVVVDRGIADGGAGLRGFHGMLTVASPRRTLEDAIRWRTRRLGNPRGDAERACYLASAIHGLALARIDGAAGASVHEALGRAFRS